MEQASSIRSAGKAENEIPGWEAAVTKLPKLLIVDDREENIFTLKRILAPLNGELHSAMSGKEALSMMLEHDYALVLLDVQMPEMDGFETATLMREHARTREIPVIFITALSKEQRYINAGYATGAVDYLLKPIDTSILLSKVRVFIELHHKRTDLESAMASLKRVSRRHKLILSCAHEGILGLDKDGQIIFSNPAAESLLHCGDTQLCGLHMSTIFEDGTDSAGDLDAVMDLIASEGRHRSEDARFIRLDGSAMPVDYSCAAIVDDDQEYAGGVLIFNDITERKNVEQQLTRLARYDDLTGLANRTLFHEFLRKAMARAKRGGREMGLLFLDLDRFKAVNDELGHTAGDSLLCEVARRLQRTIRESDLVARLGGDEFAVVLEEIESGENAARIAEKLLRELSRPVLLDGKKVTIGTSIGIALFDGDSEPPEQLIKKADTAMYEAKRCGRNRYCYYDDGIRNDVSRRAMLEADLADAVNGGKLRVHYQPQIDAETSAVVGFEALVRWFDQKRGPVAPTDFVPLAEECGLIENIGEFVIREACSKLAEWRANGLVEPDCRMAINVSVMQLHSGTLLPVIRDALTNAGLVPSDIEIELTETVVMDDAATAIEQLTSLSEFGVRVAVDDFGTGYSSLSYLQRLPIDTLKIDRSFISNLDEHSNSGLIVQSILALARTLQLDVVAEGVETAEQALFLRENGCRYLQGYYFGKPVAADVVEASLRPQPTAAG